MTVFTAMLAQMSTLIDTYGVNVVRLTRVDTDDNVDYQNMTATYTSQGNVKALIVRPAEEHRHAQHGQREDQRMEITVKGDQAVETDDHFTYGGVTYDVVSVSPTEIGGTVLKQRIELTEAKST